MKLLKSIKTPDILKPKKFSKHVIDIITSIFIIKYIIIEDSRLSHISIFNLGYPFKRQSGLVR